MAYRNIRPAGNLSTANFVLVGEQPGRTELRTNEPFTGPSGKILNESLIKAKITRAECYLTNVIKTLDRPLEHFITFKRSGAAETPEFHGYMKMLQDELSAANAEIIIAIGSVALWALTGRVGITKWRGSIIKSNLIPNCLVIPIIHPATVLPPKRVFKNRLLIEHDLSRAKQVFDGTLYRREYEIKVEPSYQDCLMFLKECELAGLAGITIDYDIEIKNMQVSCISFALGTRAISVPFIDSRGDYFPLDQETNLWLEIAKILENPAIRVRGQNITFDAHFNLRRYGIKACNFDDTMIAQRIIMPEYPIGLDFITSVWTSHPYYKADGKKFFEGGNWPRLWRYNATDSLICSEAFPKQFQEIVNSGNALTYERQRRLIEPLVFMMEKGVRVDSMGMRKRAVSMEAEIVTKRDELDRIAGQSLNPNSPKQLKDYFYIQKGYHPYKKRGTGKITTDDDAMKRLVKQGVKEAKLIQEIRALRKASSTYLDLKKVDEDGYYRCSYNPVGTRYARLSSSSNIFGTGGNMQNWPHDLLQYLLPDPDHVYYSFDLAQAENRIVAYVGKVTPMIQAFESGKDLHCLTAGLIFGKRPEEISDVAGSCSLGNGQFSERFFGKKANHGLNYDLGYKAFSQLYEIPERDAKFIVEGYHSAYPGVRSNFHAYVRQNLAANRTLTNLMGRRTRFLDEWGDSMFKEAYACIPQGTVGDLINERGLEFVYYNQELFRPISLLVQVHDSIGFQIPLSLPWIDHARMLIAIKDNLEVPLSIHGQSFVVPADLTYGFSLGKKQCKELKHDSFPTSAKDLALILKRDLEVMHETAK